MKEKISLATRLLLGFVFLLFGTNGLVMILTGKGFIPMPTPTPEMGAVFGGLFAAKYLMPLVKVLEVVAGLMLLSGKYVNLALVLLAPIVVNILGLHLFLDLAGAPMGIFLTVLLVFQIQQRWDAFRPLLAK